MTEDVNIEISNRDLQLANLERQFALCKNELADKRSEVDLLKSELMQIQLQVDAQRSEVVDKKVYEAVKLEKEEIEARFRQYVELDNSNAQTDFNDEPYVELLNKKDEEIKKLTDGNNKLSIENARVKKDNLNLKSKFDQMFQKMQCVSPRKPLDPVASSTERERFTVLMQENAMLAAENVTLKEEVSKLKEDVTKIGIEISNQTAQIRQLNNEKTKIVAENSNLIAERDHLKAKVNRKQASLVGIRQVVQKFKQDETKNYDKIRNSLKACRKDIDSLYTKSLAEFGVKFRSFLKPANCPSQGPYFDEDMKKIYEDKLDKAEKEKIDLKEKIEKNTKDHKERFDKMKAKYENQLNAQFIEYRRKSQENERLMKIHMDTNATLSKELGQYRVLFVDGLSGKEAKKRFSAFVDPQSEACKRLVQENIELRKKLTQMDNEYRLSVEIMVNDIQRHIKQIVESS